MDCVLIMAGGRGTRFWPASTTDKPKQFLNLYGNRSMLQNTVHRLKPLIPLTQIFVCTGEQYVDLVKEQLPSIPDTNIIIEPNSRNTAPCILLSSIYINSICKDANIIVLPSDHIINNEVEFLTMLKSAIAFANSNKDGIITIGIRPDRAATGYGYIKKGVKVGISGDKSGYKVEKFVEKPNLERAEFYLGEGDYLWNAGMFVFNALSMIKEFEKLAPSIYSKLIRLPKYSSSNYFSELKKLYKQCEPISIDYAIMEKSDNIYVIPGDFGWDDVGSWSALQRYLSKDDGGNIARGIIHFENASGNVVYADSKKIVVDGLDDLFVVQAGDYVIITKKDRMQNIHSYRLKYETSK